MSAMTTSLSPKKSSVISLDARTRTCIRTHALPSLCLLTCIFTLGLLILSSKTLILSKKITYYRKGFLISLFLLSGILFILPLAGIKSNSGSRSQKPLQVKNTLLEKIHFFDQKVDSLQKLIFNTKRKIQYLSSEQEVDSKIKETLQTLLSASQNKKLAFHHFAKRTLDLFKDKKYLQISIQEMKTGLSDEADEHWGNQVSKQDEALIQKIIKIEAFTRNNIPSS